MNAIQVLVPAPAGGGLNAERFYAERDHRTRVSAPLTTEPFPVALVLPREVERSAGAHLALLWAASMLRRMGRAFAGVRVVTSDEARRSVCLSPPAYMADGCTLEDAVSTELRHADPFAPVAWMNLEAPGALVGIRMALWLGGAPYPHMDVPPLGHVVAGASGWVCTISTAATSPGDTSRSGVALEGAASAVIAAAALAVGEVYRAAHPGLLPGGPRPERVWVALDTGQASTDPEEGLDWLVRGGASEMPRPWRASQGAAPRIDHLTVVSAGALGGNAARILGRSYLEIRAAAVIDPDRVELSNLNRLVEVGFGDALGQVPKAALAAGALLRAGIPVAAHVDTYEAWRAGVGHDPRLPGSAFLVGVDQVPSRLQVQSDWPFLVVNGGTSGTGWDVTVHPLHGGGCLGCWFGRSPRTYRADRAPFACGGVGGVGRVNQPQPMASYPFVSVSAAAFMVASLIHAVDPNRQHGSRTIQLNSLLPEAAIAGPLSKTEGCRLLCSAPYVEACLNRWARQEEPRHG